MSDAVLAEAYRAEESVYETVVRLARQALEGRKPDKLSGSEIGSYISEFHPTEYERVRQSLSAYLTKASQDAESGIIREPGAYGYMLSVPIVPQVDQISDEDIGGKITINSESSDTAQVDGAAPKTMPREARLYPLLQEWLVVHDYKSDNVSHFRSGGSWGNPDVAGMKLVECLHDHIDIELVTVEAKINLTNWKQFIFEAIAHKRFADRAYFAFAVRLDDADVFKIGEYGELRKYGEKYGVGVLAICFPSVVYEKLRDSTTEAVLLSDVRVIEIWPAMADRPDVVEKDRFIKNVLKIGSKSELFNFGS